jgi:hypothetical protein
MTDFAKLKELAEAAIEDGPYEPSIGLARSETDFCIAANPAVVLGLIAKIESSNFRLHEVATACATAEQERDLVAAENGRLLKLLTRVVDQHVPLTELEGVPGWSRVVELVDVTAERDALKAECEGLRVALLQVSGQIDGNIRETVRDCVNGHDDVQDIYGYCDQIDAIVQDALGKGEQS